MAKRSSWYSWDRVKKLINHGSHTVNTFTKSEVNPMIALCGNSWRPQIQGSRTSECLQYMSGICFDLCMCTIKMMTSFWKFHCKYHWIHMTTSWCEKALLIIDPLLGKSTGHRWTPITKLIDWGRVTQIFVSNHHLFKWLVAWSTASNYLNQCWNIVNWTHRNTFRWNTNHIFSFKKTHLKMRNDVCEITDILSRPQCVNTDFNGFFLVGLNKIFNK